MLRAVFRLCWCVILPTCFLVPALSHAQCAGITAVLQPLDEETLTVSETPVGLTPAKYQQSRGTAAFASFQVQGGALVYRLSGAPTATLGVFVNNGQTVPVCGLPSIQAVRFVRVSDDVTVFVSYYRIKSP